MRERGTTDPDGARRRLSLAAGSSRLSTKLGKAAKQGAARCYRGTVLAVDRFCHGSKRQTEADPETPVVPLPPMRRPFWLRLCLVVVGLLLLDAMDPFGFVSDTDQASRDIFHRVQSSVALAKNEASQDSGDPGALSGDDIRILIWTESDLQELETTWPASYAWHADILDLLLAYRPRAVFVDISFVDERQAQDPTFIDLHRVLHAYQREDAVELFVADPMPKSEDQPGYFRALWPKDCHETGAASGVSTPAPCRLAGVPVAVPGGDYDRRGIEYPFVHPHYFDEDAASEKRIIRPSVACALYALLVRGDDDTEWCDEQARRFLTAEGHAKVVTDQGDDGASLPGLTDPFRRDDEPPLIETRWSMRGDNPDTPRRNAHLECADGAPGGWSDGGASGAVWTQFHAPWRQTCGPQTSFQIIDLFRASDADLEEHVTGKVVFYAADLTAISDRVEPPTHEPLPGVYFHASAFETLLASNGDPVLASMPVLPTFEPSWISNILKDTSDLLLLIALPPLVFLALLARGISDRYLARVEARPEQVWRFYWQRLAVIAGLLVLAAGITLHICLIAVLVWGIGPLNFVGLATLGALDFIVGVPLLIPPIFGIGPWSKAAGRSFDSEVEACRAAKAADAKYSTDPDQVPSVPGVGASPVPHPARR